ncbi:S-adenosyl-L-methionine-dependent methyltransferase [Scenedesmus sp. NREL 46B-D3]|nr:S-adenosyl-L-methionine-dependent methyltransferase [Scenedesmus sp. NREL 46B-D3]
MTTGNAGAGQFAAEAAAAAAAARHNYELVTERGVEFTPGSAFYRAESAQGRDLAVLAAGVYRQQHGRLRVLDVMSGSGMRGARYLTQAGADLVWCNDYDTRNNLALVFNLVHALEHSSSSSSSNSNSSISNGRGRGRDDSNASTGVQALPVDKQQELTGQTSSNQENSSSSSSSSSSNAVKEAAEHWLSTAERVQYPGIRGDVLQWHGSSNSSSAQVLQGPEGSQLRQRCRVTHVEANRLLASTYLAEGYFDLVDVDSFGSDCSHLAAALQAVKFGGLLYLTSTDGFCSGGKRPQRSLAAYGSYLRALPHANEQGLRMLIGAAAMLRVERGGEGVDPSTHGFVGHCYVHGENRRVGWRGLSQAWCRCQSTTAGSSAAAAEASAAADARQPTPLVLSGPMWTGPLHNAGFVASMAGLAEQWGWKGSAVPSDSPYTVRQSKNNRQRPLEVLLGLLAQESDPQLPPWYACIDTLAQHLNTTPSRDKLIAALRLRGYTACQCHVENRALRTNATTQQVLQVAVEDCGYQHRSTGVPQVLLQHHQVVCKEQQQEQEAGVQVAGAGTLQEGASSSLGSRKACSE